MEPELQNKLKQIRTFEGDVAETIKNQKESIVSIQRAEVTRRESSGLPGEPNTEKSFKPFFMALGILLFFGLGGAGAYFAYQTYVDKSALPIVDTPANQFLLPTKISEIDASTLSRQAMIGVFAIERSQERGINSITQIQLRRGNTLESELLSPRDFLTRMNANASEPLMRSMSPLMMSGILGDNPPHTFLIIQINSFENAFSGMLDWEKRMAEDLLPVFADEEKVNSFPTNSPWTDLVVQNRDTRILKDPNGETVLVYGFFEGNLLIISDTEAVWRTLAERLEAQKLSR